MYVCVRVCVCVCVCVCVRARVCVCVCLEFGRDDERILHNVDISGINKTVGKNKQNELKQLFKTS